MSLPAFQRLVPPGIRLDSVAALQPGMALGGAGPVRLQLVHELPASDGGEPRGHADVVQDPVGVVQRPSRSDPTMPPSLCHRKPATTQSAVRSCLTLSIARLSWR